MNKNPISSIYIASIPFVSLFAVSSVLYLPSLVLMAIAVVFLVRVRPDAAYLQRSDALLVIIFFLGLLALFWSPALGEKNPNHAIAYLGCQLCYYWFILLWLMPGVAWNNIAAALTWSSFCAALFVICEFIAENILGIAVGDYLPYGHELSVSTVLGSYIRPRGYAVEAGHMALLFELALPFAFLHLRNRQGIEGYRYPVLIIILVGFLLLVSAASIVAMLVALCCYVFTRGTLAHRVRFLIVLAGGLAALCSWDQGWDYLFGSVASKVQYFDVLFFDSDVADLAVQNRSDTLLQAINISLAYPFGWGWGTASQQTYSGSLHVGFSGGLTNLYAEILLACGYLGLLSYLVFLIAKLLALQKTFLPYSGAVQIAFVSLMVHYFVISNYWYPIYWFVLALATKCIVEAGKSGERA